MDLRGLGVPDYSELDPATTATRVLDEDGLRIFPWLAGMLRIGDCVCHRSASPLR